MDRDLLRLALRIARATIQAALLDEDQRPDDPETEAGDARLREQIPALLRECGFQTAMMIAHALGRRNCGRFREVLLQLVEDGLVVRGAAATYGPPPG